MTRRQFAAIHGGGDANQGDQRREPRRRHYEAAGLRGFGKNQEGDNPHPVGEDFPQMAEVGGDVDHHRAVIEDPFESRLPGFACGG